MSDFAVTTAFWTSGSSGLIFLNKNWNAKRMPPLLFSRHAIAFQELKRAAPERFAKRSGYYADDQYVTFLLPRKCLEELGVRDVHVYVAGDFNDWNAVDNPHWLLTPDNGFLTLTVEWSRLRSSESSRKPIRFKFVTHNHAWLTVPSAAPNREVDTDGNTNFRLERKRTGNHVFEFKVSEMQPLHWKERVFWEGRENDEGVSIQAGDDQLDLSTNSALGTWIEDGWTFFRIFAPRANQVRCEVSQHADMSDSRSWNLRRVDPVTWGYECKENLEGYYYRYFISAECDDQSGAFNPDFPVLDPYALGTVGPRGPGIILDPRKVGRAKPFKTPQWQDLCIMELHLRDVLPEREAKGSVFQQFTDYARSEDFYPVQAGVNCVEILPLVEFGDEAGKDYHWGYMPVNYFAPESTYSQNPAKSSGIKELREMVEALHDRGLAVILDVVYNHYGEPNHLLFIDKHYYFETNEQGFLMNWSGCGNTFRANTPMGKRLIVDSLIYLVETFGFDGFRFDLAELIGVEALRYVEEELKKVKEDVILIAEPWSFRGHIGYHLRETGFASWNDDFREFVRKYVTQKGNYDGIQYFLKGSLDHLSRFPAQSVNYIESHDDHCWMDMITENPDRNGTQPTALDRRRSHLAFALLMVSVGIPMMAEGQDFLRSKGGKGNTYRDGEANRLDYGRAFEYAGTTGYCRAWIDFRLSASGKALRLFDRPGDDFMRFYPANEGCGVLAVYNFDKKMPGRRIAFAINPETQPVTFFFDDKILSGWTQIADHERFEKRGLRHNLFPVKKEKLDLPSMSLGLWIEGEEVAY